MKCATDESDVDEVTAASVESEPHGEHAEKRRAPVKIRFGKRGQPVKLRFGKRQNWFK